MKAFFLLVLLFFGFIFLASSSLANVDLTPDTPSVSAGSVPVTSGDISQTDVITIPNSSYATGNVYQVPVTGTCTNPYIVRSGDTLSSIAVICDTSFASIRLANPEITNANMIYPGQSIRIPVDTVAQPTPIAVTGGQPLAAPQAAVTDKGPSVIATQAPASGQPATAPQIAALPSGAPVIMPGTGMQVIGLDFPANTSVYIAIGPLNTGYNVVANLMTDANGRVETNIIVPPASNPNESWVVVVATTSTPIIQAASTPFYIR